MRLLDSAAVNVSPSTPPLRPDERAAPADLLTWSVADAATALGLTRRAVRYLVAIGALPAVRFGRIIRVRPADAAALVAGGTR